MTPIDLIPLRLKRGEQYTLASALGPWVPVHHKRRRPAWRNWLIAVALVAGAVLVAAGEVA